MTEQEDKCKQCGGTNVESFFHAYATPVPILHCWDCDPGPKKPNNVQGGSYDQEKSK